MDFALKTLCEVEGREREIGELACDFLSGVSAVDGSVPAILPSALDHPCAAPWQETAPASLHPTVGIVAGVHWLGMKHAWLAR